MKKLLALLLALLLPLPALAAQQSAFPAALQFSQKAASREYTGKNVYILRTYPATALPAVDAEMRALIDRMAEAGRPFLPAKGDKNRPAYLDVGAAVFRTGEKWMSFLTIARIAQEMEQTYVDFDARVYDMETGAAVTLADLFPADSPAWALLESEARRQLTAYFRQETPDEEALSALLSREALENTPFTLTPVRLQLHYRADALYPGRSTLMHVRLDYAQLRPYMTEAALRQTDNSAYKLIALTYDDGGARGASMKVLDQLRLYGANATFFIVGVTMAHNHDVLCREQDAGYAVESHNYEHEYFNLTPAEISAWRERFDAEMDAVTGAVPTYMRAPGGHYEQFIRAKVGLPLLQWSLNSSDAGRGPEKVNSIAWKVISAAQPGAVVLMHDLNANAWAYTQIILPELEKRGFLCVTVDELFAHYGVPLEADTVYFGCEAAAGGDE